MKRLIYVILITAAITGCRAKKVDVIHEQNDSTRIEQTDSVGTNIQLQEESTTQKDSVNTEKTEETNREENTVITFTDEGGTYNAQTGEATGVKNVQTSKREKELLKENTRLTKENKELKSQLQIATDSISHLQEESKSELYTEDHQEEEKLNGWQKFIQGCGYTLLAMVVFLLLYSAYRIYRKITTGT